MTEKSTPKKHRIFKRLAAVAAVIFLGLGGAGLWLRSAAGAEFVFEKIASVLAANGLTISAAEIVGPLPGGLYLRDVKIADENGLFATLAEAELRLKLRDIFAKTVHIERLTLSGPELLRLPLLPESPTEETPPEGFTLPVNVRLDELAVKGAVLHRAVFPTGPEDAPLAFAVSGAAYVGQTSTATLSATPFTADLKLEIDDVAALHSAVAGPVTVNMTGRGRLDDLVLAAKLASARLEAPGGSVEELALSVNITGRVGPLRNLFALRGDVLMRAASSPVGPLYFSTAWQCMNERDLMVKVGDLQASLGALNVTGGLHANLLGGRLALNGSLRAETADWLPLAALLGQPLSGSPASLVIDLASGSNHQSLTADLTMPNLRLAGAKGEADLLAFNDTTATVKAANLFGEADLEADISLGPGLAATAKWNGARIKASGRAGDGLFSLKLEGLEVAGLGGTARDGLELAGAYTVSEQALDIHQFALLLADSGLRLNSPTRLGFGENITLSPASLAIVPSGRLNAEMDLRPDSLNITADLAALPFSFLKPFVGPETFIPEGKLESFLVNIQRGPEGISGTADLAASVNYQGLAPTVALHGDLSGGASPALALSGAIDGGPGWAAAGELKAALPLKAGAGGGLPQMDPAAPLSAMLNFESPVEPLWTLAGQPDRLLRGALALKAQVLGTVAKPEPRGSLFLAGGRYEDMLLGLLVNDITLEAHSSPTELARAILSAKDGRGGGLALQATVQRGAGGLEMEASGRLGRFNPLQRDDVSLYLSGDIAATGPVDRPRLSSSLTVDRGEMDLKVLMASQSIPTLTIAEGEETVSSTRGPRLDLNIRVPNQFFIRGYGLDSEWQGDLTVGGVASRPSLTGRLAPVRGYFELFSREFQFSGGDISFNGGVDPNLNLELTNNGPGITALINIEGRGTAPSLSMSSRPPQPQEEVLAQVLFGKNASSLSRFEALQLAASLRELTSFGQGAFSFDPVSSVREELGLDVLRIGGAGGGEGDDRAISDVSGSLARDMTGSGATVEESVGGTSLEAGKYINDKVYVGVEHSSSGASAFRVEMELSPLMSLEARTSTESSQLGIGWKKDY